MMWMWILVGLAAWMAVSILVALVVGPVLRHCSEAREAVDDQYWTGD